MLQPLEIRVDHRRISAERRGAIKLGFRTLNSTSTGAPYRSSTRSGRHLRDEKRAHRKHPMSPKTPIRDFRMLGTSVVVGAVVRCGVGGVIWTTEVVVVDAATGEMSPSHAEMIPADASDVTPAGATHVGPAKTTDVGSAEGTHVTSTKATDVTATKAAHVAATKAAATLSAAA